MIEFIKTFHLMAIIVIESIQTFYLVVIIMIESIKTFHLMAIILIEFIKTFHLMAIILIELVNPFHVMASQLFLPHGWCNTGVDSIDVPLFTFTIRNKNPKNSDCEMSWLV